MPNRKTKPTSPGRRFATYPLREPLTVDEPERKLTEGLRKSGGRNANGRVTARHRGAGPNRPYPKKE
jgi:large subunit ribosomal protein L2